MYDIITMGSALFDVFVDTGLKEIKKGRRRLIAYPSGDKITVNNIKLSIGGGGTNTAVGFSRLGLNTAYLGKIGNGDFSKKIIDSLKKENVDFLGTKDNAVCGLSIILDSYEHNRTILTYKGPNDKLKYKEINLKKLKTKWLYLASAKGETLKTQEKLCSFAKKNKIKIAFNPSEYVARLGTENLKKILINTDVLILNRREAELLTRKKFLKGIFKKIKSYGIETICITNGKKPVFCYHKNQIYRLNPPISKVVEATGAGDAFASGFITGLIKKEDIGFALKLGLVNAQSVIQHFGAKNKLLTWKEAVKKIER